MNNRFFSNRILSVICCLMLISCGFKLSGNADNYPDVNFVFSNRDNKRDIMESRVFWKILALAKDTKTEDDYYCEITNIAISNARVATNATGDTDSYKLFVAIDYKLFDRNKNLIDQSKYNLMEIYQIDQSLYSAEVKYDQIIDTSPKAFLNHIYQKLLLQEQ